MPNLTPDQIEKQQQRWSSRFTASQSAQQQLFTDAVKWYDNFYAVYNQKVAPWRSKVLDPKIAQATLNVIYKITNTDPQPFVEPTHANDFQSASNAQALLEWDVNNPMCEEPLFKRRYSVICDAAVAGTGFALMDWELEDYELKRRNKGEDGKVKLDEDKVTKTKIGYNEWEPISIFRMFLEPGAKSLHESSYVIYLDFKEYKEIEEHADASKGYLMDAVKKLKNQSPTGSNSDNRNYEQSRNRLINLSMGGSASSDSGKLQIKVCYDKEENKFYYFAENILYRVEENQYWHKKFPGIAYYIRPRAHSAWGDGFFERTMRLGAANDAILNQFLDQLSLSLNGMIMHDRNTTVDANVIPGGSIVWDGTEKPEMVAIPQPDISGFQTAQQGFQRMIEENTLSGYDTGNPASAVDKTSGTKGGIVAIQQAGNDKIKFMARMMGSCYQQEFEMRLSNIMQFFDRKRSVRILGEAGNLFPIDLSPEDITSIGSYDVKVGFDLDKVDSSEYKSQQKIAFVDRIIAIAAAAKQSEQPIAINWTELARIGADVFDIKGVDRIIEPVPMAGDSPENENRLFLMGKGFSPSEGDDHELHIEVHEELLADTGIHRKVKSSMTAHVLMHKRMLEEQIMQQAFGEATKPTLGGMITNNAPINEQPVPIQSSLQAQAQPAAPGGVQGAMASPEAGAALPPQPSF